MTSLMNGCQNGNVVNVNCPTWVKPFLVDEGWRDRFTRFEREQILLHNDDWEDNCD